MNNPIQIATLAFIGIVSSALFLSSVLEQHEAEKSDREANISTSERMQIDAIHGCKTQFDADLNWEREMYDPKKPRIEENGESGFDRLSRKRVACEANARRK